MTTSNARGARSRTQAYVPARLQEKIFLHLIRNTIGSASGPLIQLLHGLPGEGKTFSLWGILAELAVTVFLIDSSQFESSDAGGPVQLLREIYLKAEAMRSGRGGSVGQGPPGQPQAAAILIDDVDLALGQFGDLTQYTVNRQLLLGFLQALCDSPSRLLGTGIARVPIFMTANDLTVMHGPLVRSGRAEVLSWKLSLDERKEIVGRIFPALGENEIERLVDWFPLEPVAFYADLKRLWADELARAEMGRRSPREVLRLALEGQWRVGGKPPTLTDLRALGRKAQEARRIGPWEEDSDGKK